MWFWNSKEFYMGNSLAEYSRLKQLLANNNIRYNTKMSSMSGSGSHSGTNVVASAADVRLRNKFL